MKNAKLSFKYSCIRVAMILLPRLNKNTFEHISRIQTKAKVRCSRDVFAIKAFESCLKKQCYTPQSSGVSSAFLHSHSVYRNFCERLPKAVIRKPFRASCNSLLPQRRYTTTCTSCIYVVGKV